MAIIDGYRCNNFTLFGRVCYIYCYNKPSAKRATRAEKIIFEILKIYYLPRAARFFFFYQGNSK